MISIQVDEFVGIDQHMTDGCPGIDLAGPGFSRLADMGQRGPDFTLAWCSSQYDAPSRNGAGGIIIRRLKHTIGNRETFGKYRFIVEQRKGLGCNSGYIAPAVPNPSATYSHLIEHVVRETADSKDVVIVAHGASHALGGRPEVLRVFVTGSPQVRAERLARESAVDAGAAKKTLEASDKERGRYLERFYDVRSELPVHYDLTVNTDFMAPTAAAALIVAAVQA